MHDLNARHKQFIVKSLIIDTLPTGRILHAKTYEIVTKILATWCTTCHQVLRQSLQ